jgi:methionyl-tRNA formyltransferase
MLISIGISAFSRHKMEKSMRIVFMGSPDFAIPALRAICNVNFHDILAVYCQPAKPAGRGNELRKCAVHTKAENMLLW